MKLMRYSRRGEKASHARLGVLVGNDQIADLRAGYARYLTEEIGNSKGRELASIFLPPYLAQFLHIGTGAMEALSEAYGWLSDLVKSEPDALGLAGEQLFISLSECRLHAPMRSSKIIIASRNYPRAGRSESNQTPKMPAAYIKVSSSIVGPGRDIFKPAMTEQLDFRAGLAVVIGKRCKHVPEERAYDVIAGYTILGDVVARDIERGEREAERAMLARTLDTFAPMGPWLVTKVEVPDPMNLRITTRVNGEVRADFNTSEMTYSIPQLVAYMSQMTLMPGDMISTGAPPHAAHAGQRYLNAGDMLEAEVEKIGTLVNAVVDEPRH
jgi:2-keto-4-pentenoate hydratase/2-oxohepta-3-ene-1,7-dioic acid hydratase in catechol pathway